MLIFASLTLEDMRIILLCTRQATDKLRLDVVLGGDIISVALHRHKFMNNFHLFINIKISFGSLFAEQPITTLLALLPDQVAGRLRCICTML